MNWKYSETERQMVFPEPPERVLEAARRFGHEALSDWQISDTPDGFEGKGGVWGHAATAVLHCQPAPSGTLVTITLRVERAGSMGYTLYDLGVYNGELEHWIKGIQWQLTPRAANAPVRKEPTQGTKLLLGVFVFSYAIFALAWIFQLVMAIVSLFTGWLFVETYGGSGSGWYHGATAKWGAIAIIAVNVVLAASIFSSMHAKKRSASA